MEIEGSERVLFVDDEPHVLHGIRRMLFELYDVETATSGEEGLQMLLSEGPFAVVVSDMRMPRMDGADFLSRVRQLAPDSVRMLLTGQTDVEAAIRAINDGEIFRFLCKPCSDEVMQSSLRAASRQYQLVVSERQLLEKTLGGAVKVLVEILGLAAPVAFSRATALKSIVAHLAKGLGLTECWRFEMAAMLSQTGCITLAEDTLERAYAGQELTEQERTMVEEHPMRAHALLSNIPRLEEIAEMIRRQNEVSKPAAGDEVALGASLLRLALDFDRLCTTGMDTAAAVTRLKATRKYDDRLLEHLKSFEPPRGGTVVKAVRVSELYPNMVFDEDVCALPGNVLGPKGREGTRALIERLRGFAQGSGIQQPIRVRLAG